MKKFLVLLLFLITGIQSQENLQNQSVPNSNLMGGTPLNLVNQSPENPLQSGLAKLDSSNSNLFKSIPVADSLKIPVLDFKNTDVRDILRGIGMQYNVNIFLEPDVSGQLSLYLVDIKVKNAIDFIIKRAGCIYTVDNGIVKVSKYKAPIPAPPPPPPQVLRIRDGLVDVDFREISPRDAASLFGDSLGINVIIESTIDKKISSKLVRMKPEKAIKTIFESNGLQVTVIDGVYYVNRMSWGNENKDGQSDGNVSKRLSINVKNGKTSLEIDNAPLDNVIRTIATQSNINLVMYDRITGDITAKLQNASIDDCLRFLLQNTKFTFWKEKEIYFIGSREMNQQKTTVTIPLRHIMADESEIGKILPPSISSNATIKYDGVHNALVVIGSFDVVAQTQEFIDKIDKPIPQVLIEALVVDFNISKIQEFGMSFFTQSGKDSAGQWLSEQFLPNLDLKPGRQHIKRRLTEVLNDISKGLGDIVYLPENFRAKIQALESADIVKVHSTPQIATINGNPATITIGETRYYKLTKETKAPVDNQTAVIGTDQRFEVLKFNTQLQVTPWVMDQGYVMVKIRPEFNIPRQGGDAGTPPNVDTRIIESMVRLKNGQTVVLGGQRQTENMVSRNGVPFLSSIPILGWIFSSRKTTRVETQMMIFLTPKVYYGDDNAVSPDDYFGREVNRILRKYGIDKKVKEDLLDSVHVSKKSLKENRISKTKSVTNLQPDTTNTPKKVENGKKSVRWYWPWIKNKGSKK